MKEFLKKFWISWARCLCRLILRISWKIKTVIRLYMQRTAGQQQRLQRGFISSPELLEQIKEKGVDVASVTLHVGLGTFRPVKAENILDHHMHSEFYRIEEEEAAKINRAKEKGGRIICVGTTSCRTVESAADENGRVKAGSGWTDIFIYPGYQYKAIDGLITNFHLPESTLIMLVSAFCGYENTMRAYRVAVEEKYRFFSFGDAMYIG